MKFSLTNFAVLLLAASAARAEDWTITTADFHSQPASVLSLSSDGLGITEKSSTQPVQSTISLDQFVSATRPAQSAPAATKFTLLLSGGDRLSGTPAGIADEKLTWNNPRLGQMIIPLRRLVALGHGDGVSAPDTPPKQDVITLANGDVVSGVLSNCTSDTITITTDAGPANVPLASVNQAVFAATAGARGGIDHGFRIRLSDGSIVSAASASIAQNQLTMTLASNPPQTVSLDVAQVAGIEQIGGPVRWLSSLVPIENVQIPYFGAPAGLSPWPARFDASVDRSPIEFNGRRFDHGIGVHAYSRLTFALDPGWSAFRTQYAIDQRSDAPRPLADVTVRIHVDGKVVYEHPHVHAGELSSIVVLDISGAKQLTLEADYGDAGDIQGHLDWIEPALLRQAGATTGP